MDIALQRTYAATPEPKRVVAVSDCGCTGGIFGENYASCGRVANVIPVDVIVRGCPRSPVRILQGILTAIASGNGSGALGNSPFDTNAKSNAENAGVVRGRRETKECG